MFAREVASAIGLSVETLLALGSAFSGPATFCRLANPMGVTLSLRSTYEIANKR